MLCMQYVNLLNEQDFPMNGDQQCIRFVLDNERDNMQANVNRKKVMHQVKR
jgi:chorismate mutase